MDVRKAIKGLAALTMDHSGARQVISSARRLAAGGRRVLVFGYHRVCTDFQAGRENSIESCLISKSTFAQHVGYLADHYELATMSRAVDVLSGRAPAERDLAVITFDDGYQDVLENAVPVLRAAKAPATIYVSSGVIKQAGYFPHDRLYSLLLCWVNTPAMRTRAGAFAWEAIGQANAVMGGGPRDWIYFLIRNRPPQDLEQLCDALSLAADLPAKPPAAARALNWDEVQALSECGFEIGAHTTSHCVLTHLDAATVEADLLQSREAIEHAIGKPVRHFAYCNGYYNQTVIAALKKTGYASAVTTEDRLNRLGDDPFCIARRVLWEKSAYGPNGRTLPSLLACQLDDTWTSMGFNSSESGQRPEPKTVVDEPQEERRTA